MIGFLESRSCRVIEQCRRRRDRTSSGCSKEGGSELATTATGGLVLI